MVASAACAGEAEVAAAVDAASDGFRAWSSTPAAKRASALLGAAAWLRERRLELAALQVRECAKPWREADGDVCEAIDFLEYYARGAIALERAPELLQVPGERNVLRYVPRGVVGVISPWNFPLAIPCGMTAAALATGNTVVLKPAEQSPGCALCSCARCTPAASPPRRSRCCPARATSGRRWSRHPEVADDRLHRLAARRPGDHAPRPQMVPPASGTSSAWWPSSGARTA